MWDGEDMDLAFRATDDIGGKIGVVVFLVAVVVVAFLVCRDAEVCAKMKCSERQVPEVIHGKCVCVSPATEP